MARLRADSTEFGRIWDERETWSPRPENIAFMHPVLGVLRFHSVRLSVEDFGGLIFFLPPADDATKIVLRSRGDVRARRSRS